MGDMADDIIDEILSNPDTDWSDPAKRCKHCGAFPLYWLNQKGKWVLIDQKGKRHICQNLTREDPFHGL